MGIYSQASEVWDGLEIGQKITERELRERGGLDQSARRTVASFLSRRIRRREAVKDGKRDGFTLYKKIAAAEAPKGQPRPEEREITDREIGNAVLKVIDNLKAQLRSEKETTKDLIEENKQLKDLYEKAQTRILELNEELQRREPGKAVKMSDLQELTK
jgi:hypothetical protein